MEVDIKIGVLEKEIKGLKDLIKDILQTLEYIIEGAQVSEDVCDESYDEPESPMDPKKKEFKWK